MKIVATLGWALAATALSGTQSNAWKAIQAQYYRWSKAYMTNDIDTLLDILAPEYTLTNVNKDVMTYPTYKAYLRLRKNGPKDTTRYSTEIRKLTVKGSNADVDSIETMLTVRPDKSGQVLESTHRHEYQDRWRFYEFENKWRLVSTVTVKETTTVRKAKSQAGKA